MKMGYPTISAHTHAHTAPTTNTVSYIDSLDLSDVSDLEDHFLTTSDEEELPGLEEGTVLRENELLLNSGFA